MSGTAPTTDRLAALVFCWAVDLAVPAADLAVPATPAAEDAASEEAPAAAERAGLSAFDRSHAALFGSSVTPLLVTRDRRCPNPVFPMITPRIITPPR